MVEFVRNLRFAARDVLRHDSARRSRAESSGRSADCERGANVPALYLLDSPERLSRAGATRASEREISGGAQRELSSDVPHT